MTDYTGEDDQDSNIKKILKLVNKRAIEKAFKQGVGALLEEAWRLRDEEGMYFENDEERITELIEENFITI